MKDKYRINAELIINSITDKEIEKAVFQVKEKALAWDWITHWNPKLMVMYSPNEIE